MRFGIVGFWLATGLWLSSLAGCANPGDVVASSSHLPSARGGEAAPVSASSSALADAPRASVPAHPRVRIETPLGAHEFRVELAESPQERARGLMFREALGAEEGMLFLTRRMHHQSFWMKNTLIPLDMLFIDAEGMIVGIVENAEPFSEASRSVPHLSQYVLELNGGTCRRLGIGANAQVRFIDVPGHNPRSGQPGGGSTAP